MNRQLNIYVAGHSGMVGSAILRRLQEHGYKNIIMRTSSELNLTDQHAVAQFFKTEKIDEVYLAAARVGGIYANDTYPAEFIYQNLMIEANVIHQAWVNGVQKLLFLGSSCIYPKDISQPMSEGALLSGKLEPTNEPYAIAKIAGIKLCESYNRQYGTDYRSVIPTNLYGMGDNYHAQNSHVIPALLRKIHEAKIAGASSVLLWGTGGVYREFLYVDDMAEACFHIMSLSKESYQSMIDPMQSHINIGSGEEVTIAQLANALSEVIGFQGEIKFDASMPDGVKRKLVLSHKLKQSGWKHNTSLSEGLKKTYQHFLTEINLRDL